MTRNEALDFLKQHQPMPGDSAAEGELIEKYDQARKFFLAQPDEECIPLFLNSFGDYDGLGVYQMVEDVIVQYDKEAVLPHILTAMKSRSDYIKYWCAQISSNFPDEALFTPLTELLQSGNEDIMTAAATSLAQLALNGIMADEVGKALERACEAADEDTRDLIEEIIEDIRS